MSDPHQVLGLEPGASREAVDAAYRRLVRRYPPELHPERFSAIHRCYRFLSSFENRMNEIRRAEEPPLDALFPMPPVKLRPPGEPPAPFVPGDAEPLLAPLRRELLKRLLEAAASTRSGSTS
ncbi:MAG: J domain-containing protein [Thermoanaerobaculia bacterium]